MLIYITYFTDMFPTNAVPPILGVARKLHAQTALQSWDICKYRKSKTVKHWTILP